MKITSCIENPINTWLQHLHDSTHCSESDPTSSTQQRIDIQEGLLSRRSSYRTGLIRNRSTPEEPTSARCRRAKLVTIANIHAPLRMELMTTKEIGYQEILIAIRRNRSLSVFKRGCEFTRSRFRTFPRKRAFAVALFWRKRVIKTWSGSVAFGGTDG